MICNDGRIKPKPPEKAVYQELPSLVLTRQGKKYI